MAGEGLTALIQQYGQRKAQGIGSGTSQFLNVKRAFEDAKRVQAYKLQEQEQQAYHAQRLQGQQDTAAMARQKEANAGALATATAKVDPWKQAESEIVNSYGGTDGLLIARSAAQQNGTEQQFENKLLKAISERARILGFPEDRLPKIPEMQPSQGFEGILRGATTGIDAGRQGNAAPASTQSQSSGYQAPSGKPIDLYGTGGNLRQQAIQMLKQAGKVVNAKTIKYVVDQLKANQ